MLCEIKIESVILLLTLLTRFFSRPSLSYGLFLVAVMYMIVAPLAMFYSYGDSTKDLQLTAPGIFGLFAYPEAVRNLAYIDLEKLFSEEGRWVK